MINKLKFLCGTINTHPVFVIGSGRSGTHWLGYSLSDHPEIRATIEVEPMFKLSTKMALNSTLEDKLYIKLIRAYKWQLIQSTPKLYLDKSHPNIWIADKLKKTFPQALFIGIERNPYATVASMIRHKKVSSWHKRWREFPLPNRFLGITENTASAYEDLPLASQCAMRWLAHHNKMSELKETLKEDLLVISYEKFAYNPEKQISKLQQFLKLETPIPVPEVKAASLHNWKKQLSTKEIEDIEAIVGFPPK